MPLGWRECPEELRGPLLAERVGLGQHVGPQFGERDRHGATVGGVRRPLHEATGLETVDDIGGRARGNAQVLGDDAEPGGPVVPDGAQRPRLVRRQLDPGDVTEPGGPAPTKSSRRAHEQLVERLLVVSATLGPHDRERNQAQRHTENLEAST